LIATDRIPPGKRNILLDQLVVLRNRRHYQAPGHKHKRGCVAQFHGGDLPESKRPEQRPASMTFLADKSVMRLGFDLARSTSARPQSDMAFEIDPGYVAVALERFSMLGLRPKLLSP
jgi:hypothetical protein